LRLNLQRIPEKKITWKAERVGGVTMTKKSIYNFLDKNGVTPSVAAPDDISLSE